MKLSIVSQKLWKSLQPLLPLPARSRRGGRPRQDDRATLNGILFVLITGIPWEDLPQELSLASGVTCWRRLRDWQAQGIWDHRHLALLTQLPQCDQIDWSRASIDGASVTSPGGPGNRPQPHRPGQAGQQATHHHRPARCAAGPEYPWR